MKITEMSDKLKNAKGSFKTRNLEEVVAGGSAEDFLQDGDLVKIVEQSKEGFYDERFGKNAVVVIMERCVEKDGKIEGTGEAVQFALSNFDRAVVPYRKEADGQLVRDGETIRADGTAVVSWKASKSAKAFMTDNMGKVMRYTVKQEVSTRAWNRAANTWSDTELMDRKVGTINWA